MRNKIFDKRVLLTIYALFALAASMQSLLSGPKKYIEGGQSYNRYNNYTIFEKSYKHLKDQKDLYVLYPDEHWDLYKYTPTFSAFFGFFSILPDWAGLSLWNLLNALLFVLAIYYLPVLSQAQKSLALWITLVEMMTSLQNAQSNALIAGLLIFSWGLLENKKYLAATLCILLSIFIKPFGIVGLALFILYPQKGKLLLYSLLWGFILLLIPFLFIDFNQYYFLSKSYLDMLMTDHTISYGYSVMGWLHTWFRMDISKNLVVGAGILLFLVPLVKIRHFTLVAFRYLVLCSVLLWIVIFNHKAESPTFIIAMAGVSLWFVLAPKNGFNILLIGFAFLFTSLSSTDIFPAFIRKEYVNPYCLKVVPCILVWLKIGYELLILPMKNQSTPFIPSSADMPV